MVASIQIGTASSYYAREYYHGGERQLAATWFAPANHFGVKDGATVDIDLFTQLHAGLDATGKLLLTTTGRRVEGIDITFSPGKSVSLAYGLTTNKTLQQDIMEAHHRSVRAALTVLNDEAIYARRGRDGLLREKVDLTGALFTHDTSRPERHLDGSVFSDPQIHTHAVCYNLAIRADGTIGGIDTRLGHHKLMVGGVYHAHLAYELSKLGFTIQEIGRNGTFEVGFDPHIRKFFSARREQIEEHLAEAGLDSAAAPAAAAAAALSTRRNKMGYSGDERFALWQTKAAELGLIPTQCVEHLRNAENESTLGNERIFAKALASLPNNLTEFEATFLRRNLIRAVANAYVGTSADPTGLLQSVDRLINSEAVVEIRRDPLGEPIYSTSDMIKLERETLGLARDLATRHWPSLNSGQLDRRAIASGLSPEQAVAASVLAQPRCLALLEGKAGTGKTQGLKPLVGQLAAEGYRVIAASTAWRTSEMLATELGVEARAIDSWLAIARTGGRFLDDRTVLIVDEVGLMGVRATNSILKHAAHIPVSGAPAKIILCGDAAQLKPIAAGAGIELVRATTESARLNTIVRQRDPAMRRAVGYLSRGEVVAGYDKLAAIGCVVEAAGHRQTMATAVDTWFARRTESPKASHLLLVRTNATLRALNTEIRRRLRHDGQIRGPDVTIGASSATGEPFSLKVAAGDRIRFTVRAKLDGQRIINGTSATVEHIEPGAFHHARIVARIGRRRVAFSTKELADENGHARLAHDYATTVYAAQGLTAESCTVVVDPGYDRHSLYVSASRARANTTLIVDVSAIDAIVVADRPYSTRKNEVTADQRRAALLARLSRSQHKTTTLEATHIAEYARRASAADGVRQSRVKKELGYEL